MWSGVMEGRKGKERIWVLRHACWLRAVQLLNLKSAFLLRVDKPGLVADLTRSLSRGALVLDAFLDPESRRSRLHVHFFQLSSQGACFVD